MLTGFTGSLFADQEEIVEDSKSEKLAAWEQVYLATSGKNAKQCQRIILVNAKNDYKMFQYTKITMLQETSII